MESLGNDVDNYINGITAYHTLVLPNIMKISSIHRYIERVIAHAIGLLYVKALIQNIVANNG